jgi:hypothetical protein
LAAAPVLRFAREGLAWSWARRTCPARSPTSESRPWTSKRSKACSDDRSDKTEMLENIIYLLRKLIILSKYRSYTFTKVMSAKVFSAYKRTKTRTKHLCNSICNWIEPRMSTKISLMKMCNRKM